MIKKILVTFLILIFIIAIGIVSLIVFVDPNNFRGFISDKVRDKTGYELSIEGDLRWHIWPQVSILTDSVKLTDTGAQKPILTADNMRLDVELFPLFSKKIVVKNVFVKSAVINVTDDSKGQVAKSKESNSTAKQPVPNTEDKSQQNEEKEKSSWKFTLNKFEVADSTLVFQNKDTLINFRNLNLIVQQNSEKYLSVDIKGNIDRNQQDLYYSAIADIDLTQFPNIAKIDLKKFDYTLKGIGIPNDELVGNLKGIINYQKNPQSINTQNLIFSINDNIFTGNVNVNLNTKPSLELNLNSDKLNVNTFISNKEKSKENTNINPQQTTPVVSSVNKSTNELTFLNAFDANLKLNIKQLIANKMVLNNVYADLQNNDGVATIKAINFDFADGTVTTNGVANGKQKNTLIKLNTKINNVDLNNFFNQIDTAKDLVGRFNASGQLEINTIKANKLLENLHGNLAINIANAKLDNINIQNIINAAAAKYSKDVLTPENQNKYTEFHTIEAKANLNNGNLELTTLTADSETIDIINGSGRVGMLQKDIDVNLNIKMLDGWNGKSDTIAKLQQMTIPLRIYGQFTKLHYQIDLNQVFKDVLNDKLQHGLEKLREKIEKRNSKDNDKDKDKDKDKDDNNFKSKSRQKAANILSELLKK